MSIKAIDLKFTSGNSTPVDRATVTRKEWESVKECAGELAEALEATERATDLWLPATVEDEYAHEATALHKLRRKQLNALNKYREISHE